MWDSLLLMWQAQLGGTESWRLKCSYPLYVSLNINKRWKNPSQVLWLLPINYFLKVNSFWFSFTWILSESSFSGGQPNNIHTQGEMWKNTITHNTTFCFKNPETQIQPRAVCNSRFSKHIQTIKPGKKLSWQPHSLKLAVSLLPLPFLLLFIFHLGKNTVKVTLRWMAWSFNSAYYFRFTQ